MEKILNELIEMCSSEKIREFRSHPKKVYKYYLAGILNDIIFGNEIHKSFFYHQAKFMSILPSSHPNKDGQGYRKIKQDTIRVLKDNYFKSPETDSQVDLIISFLRNYLNDLLAKGKTLYLVSELENIVQLKKFYHEYKDYTLKNHYWVDISLRHSIVVTIPEFFTYQDLINLWNDYINKFNQFKELHEKGLAKKSNPKFRELDYSIKGSERTLIILATNFVESYLYFYFYNIKSTKLYPTNKVVNFNGYVHDTMIIEDLIFSVHNSMKDNTDIQTSYLKLKETIGVRDRFVHTSAFVDESKKMGQLQPLLSIDINQIVNHLQNAIDFVYLIDSNLPSNEKILFWWDQFETPDFSKHSYINPLNISNI
ncbi:hypothetical protein [Lysinibacillus fusiformis]|uniref:hypothetical protein n=1 Tax=Lysinibacillus fusiformis TaxID=28031 RepID=UPI0023A9D461|nr:hypothetical protein [Lysinibacillus fusiformis]WEA41636.1 hypothetical protein PWJ66_23140 [Lysinibacillus fusiformis]